MNMTMQHNIELGPREVDKLIDREIRTMAQEMSSTMDDLLEESRNGHTLETADYLQLHAVAVFLAENVAELAAVYELDPLEWWKSVKRVGDEAFEDYQLRRESVTEASQPNIDEGAQ